ncbi:MAG: FAD-dependent monooxygenase [Phaeodactylibacter sp.]|nr:FAD-dependent monooxygenase [Phaeodactylibacter sp.]MCB9051658.1 FAD-dependent monooxygenase [Lewinellaceae bacterium]
MERKRSTDVLIIGGGPVGMVSGIYLDKLGISSIIVERQFELSQHPKAHELSARSIEILCQLGFTLEELRKEASRYEDASRILFCHTINAVIGEIDLQEGGNDEKYKTHLAAPEPYLNLSQTELEKIMRQKLSACPGCHLLIGHQWESMSEISAGMESKILDRRGNNTFTISSKYVICADGAGSPSRKALGITMAGDEKLDDFISVYFESNLRDFVKRPAKLYWILNPEAPGTIIAHHIEKRWVYHFPIYTPHEKKEQFTKEMLKRRLLMALGEENIPLDIKSISFWRMACQAASAFRKGRCFLVGDAAHRFPPTGGLGMNSGIGDVQNLCWKLAMVINGVASERLLDSYEAERRPVIELNSRESLRNYRKIWDVPRAMGLNPDLLPLQAKVVNSYIFKLFPKAWTNGLLRRIYRTLSKKVAAIPAKPVLHEKVKQGIKEQTEHFDRIGLDLGYTYDNGAIIYHEKKSPPQHTVSAYFPSIEPGARFPHFWVYEKDTRTSSHEWLHPGRFTLLCNEEGEKWWSANKSRLDPGIQKAIQARNIGKLLQNQPDTARERAFYDISSVPLLLIRPDGQVAWQPESLQADPADIFNQLLP